MSNQIPGPPYPAPDRVQPPWAVLSYWTVGRETWLFPTLPAWGSASSQAAASPRQAQAGGWAPG